MPDVPSTAARCLPVSDWPTLDRERWNRAGQKGGLLDDASPAAEWAPITQESVAKSYGRWLHWLGANGQLDRDLAPEQRLTRDNIKAYVAALSEHNAPNTVHMRLLHLSRMLEAMTPNSAPDWLADIVRKLRSTRRPVRDDRTRLLPVDTLVALGWARIERAESNPSWSVRRRALHHRDGFLILLLCACPIRARNLSNLSIGSSFQRRGDGWWISFSTGELKNKRRSADLPLPPHFTEAIENYLTRWRPILLARQRIYGENVDTERLWLSESGQPMKPKQFHELLDRVIHRELGTRFGPHLFRKVAPTELAIHDPAHVRIAQPLLTHATFETTDQSYNLSRSLDAARRVQATLTDLRRQARVEAVPGKEGRP